MGKLNQLERNIKATTYFQRADLDIKAKGVDKGTVQKVKKLSSAFQNKDTDQFQKQLDRIVKGNTENIDRTKRILNEGKGIGSVDYTIDTLDGNNQNIDDATILLKASVNEEFGLEVISDELEQLNSMKSVKDLGGVKRGEMSELSN